MAEHTRGPWVWCDWNILPEDRGAQKAGEPYWTMIEGCGSLARGPIGRKSMWPESIINAEGYEVEGISAGNDADAALIAAAPDLLAALKRMHEAFNAKQPIPTEEGNALEVMCRDAITKAEGLDDAKA